MNHLRCACAVGTIVFSVGCSGKSSTGADPSHDGGAAAGGSSSGGANSGIAGSSIASSGTAGSGEAGTAQANGGIGGTPSAAGSAGQSVVTGTAGSAGAADTNYCGVALPTTTTTVQLATPQVVWNRVQLFLLGAAAGAPPMLPAATTRQWAGDLAASTLDALNGRSAPGLTKFVSAWWPGTPNAEKWGELFSSPKMTLTDLLTTTSVANPGSGVLTDPAVLQTPSITARGVFIDRYLLCVLVPPSPANIVAAPVTPGETRRQWLEASLGPSPVCNTCHTVTDPLGDSLNHYDATGTLRSLENGSPVDSSGTFTVQTTGTISFADVNELGAKLAGTCGVAQCLVQQLLADAESTAKLPVPGSKDPQTVAAIASALDKTGDLRSVIRGIVESDTFLRAQ